MMTRLASPEPAFMYMSASAPDAPPLSETTIGCFIRLFFCIAACIIRAIWSEAPPAPAATTISTGLFGSHATAGGVTSTMVSAAPAPMQIVLIILSSLDCTHGQRPAAALLVCWSGILPLCARGSRALSGPRLFGNNAGIDNLENLDATIAVDPKSNEACIADDSLNERCYWRRIPALTATPRHFSMSPRMRSVSAPG